MGSKVPPKMPMFMGHAGRPGNFLRFLKMAFSFRLFPAGRKLFREEHARAGTAAPPRVAPGLQKVALVSCDFGQRPFAIPDLNWSNSRPPIMGTRIDLHASEP